MSNIKTTLFSRYMKLWYIDTYRHMFIGAAPVVYHAKTGIKIIIKPNKTLKVNFSHNFFSNYITEALIDIKRTFCGVLNLNVILNRFSYHVFVNKRLHEIHIFSYM